MNRNLKQTIWVLALGIAFTGLSTTSLTAAAPAQQYPAQQDQDRNQNRDRNDNQFGDKGYFQQGLQDGQHDRQFGGNRTDHRQPNNDARAYQDGYRQGLRNTSPEQQTYRSRAFITSNRVCGTASTIVSMAATARITSNLTTRMTFAPTETTTNTDIATSP